MYRVSIPYPSQTDGRFNWDYYMNNHLPLAVGTSMRHCEINYCDADRPETTDSPFACICMVHFETEDDQKKFCGFFAEGHPDAGTIGNDEINYTNIEPGFVTSRYRRINGSTEIQTGYRVKAFFTGDRIEESEENELVSLLEKISAEQPELYQSNTLSEIDFGIGGLMPDSTPGFSFIWANSFSTLDTAESFLHLLENTEGFSSLKVKPVLMLSQVLGFDLSLTSPYSGK